MYPLLEQIDDPALRRLDRAALPSSRGSCVHSC
jgi:hypothetical protein